MPTHIFKILFSTLLTLLFMVTLPAAAKKKPSHAEQCLLAMAEPDAIATRAQRDRLAQRHSEVWTSKAHINEKSRNGIDVSHYQYEIDWDEVAAAKISYAYIKATEGASLVDEYYDFNIREARRAGISVGAYHFYRPNVDIHVQLQNLKSTVKKEDIDLVPLIDVETRGSVSATKFVEDLRQFLILVEKHYGRKPMLYTYQNFYNKHFLEQFKDYHWMIACYSDNPPTLNDGKGYIMWQYTQRGRVSGVRGNVDRSQLVGHGSLRQIAM